MRFPVAVVFRHTPLVNRWVSGRWDPFAVEPEPSPSPDEAAVSEDGACWRFAGQWLELHRSEAEGYHLNLTAPDPKVFVMWRLADPGVVPPVHPVVVTVSYNEAARMLDGGEQVDAVPLPATVRQWMEPFVAAHYKPEARRKVRRNDPFRDEAERQRREPRR